MACLGLADASGRFDQRLKDRFKFPSRPADRRKHVAGRGLIFQRLLKIAVRVCNARYVSALVMAITACSAKVFSRSIWLSVKPPVAHGH